MSRRVPRIGVGRAVALAGALYTTVALAARPWMERWGSTEAERTRSLPGDELVPDSDQQTHGITINAPPDDVWRWLVQMGQGRAGFYTHDRLERLFGAAIRNADEIHPEWQRVAVGDLVRTYRPMPRFEPLGWIVSAVDPRRTLVVHEPERGGVISSSWAFALEREGRGRPYAVAVSVAVPPPRRGPHSIQVARLRPGPLHHGDRRPARAEDAR